MKIMKLFYNISAAVILVGAVLTACTKLDLEPQGSTITSAQKEAVVAANPQMVSASVSGIFTMFSVYMNANPGYSRHNDFGYGALMLFMDTRGTDLVGDDIGYNWFSYGLDMMSDHRYNSLITQNFWNTMYNQIYTANQVIAIMDPETEDSVAQYYLAQALAVRAFDYFNLAQMYQHTYIGHESLPCVPLILDTNADQAAAEGAARNSVQEVYDQIVKDIDLAVSLLEKTGETRPDKRYVSLAVAKGLRARIRLVMHDYAGAAADAKDVIESGEATPKSFANASKPTFKSMDEEDWLWGIKIAETDRVVTSGIVNWPSHMGSLNYGYASVGAWRKVNIKLWNSIPSSDCRKGWFLDADSMSPNLSAEQQDYVINDAGCPGYTQVKFAPYGDELYTSTNANDIPLMRIEEMYLILAEAQAETGKAADGCKTLQDFVTTYRNPAYNFESSSKDAVVNEAFLQRRIELWGEGLSYFDIQRRNKGFDRRGGGFEEEFVFIIQPEDPILIFQIPDSEIQANKLISAEDNNPGATTPTPVPDEQ